LQFDRSDWGIIKYRRNRGLAGYEMLPPAILLSMNVGSPESPRDG